MRNEELEKDHSYLSILYKENWLKFYERWLFSEERKNEHKESFTQTFRLKLIITVNVLI